MREKTRHQVEAERRVGLRHVFLVAANIGGTTVLPGPRIDARGITVPPGTRFDVLMYHTPSARYLVSFVDPGLPHVLVDAESVLESGQVEVVRTEAGPKGIPIKDRGQMHLRPILDSVDIDFDQANADARESMSTEEFYRFREADRAWWDAEEGVLYTEKDGTVSVDEESDRKRLRVLLLSPGEIEDLADSIEAIRSRGPRWLAWGTSYNLSMIVGVVEWLASAGLLPKDAVPVSVGTSIERRAVSVLLWSRNFPVTSDGEVLSLFRLEADIEQMPDEAASVTPTLVEVSPW